MLCESSFADLERPRGVSRHEGRPALAVFVGLLALAITTPTDTAASRAKSAKRPADVQRFHLFGMRAVSVLAA